MKDSSSTISSPAQDMGSILSEYLIMSALNYTEFLTILKSAVPADSRMIFVRSAFKGDMTTYTKSILMMRRRNIDCVMDPMLIMTVQTFLINH